MPIRDKLHIDQLPITIPSHSPSPSPASFPSRRSRWRSRRWRKFANSEPFWILLYFLFNLGLTLYNKLVLVRFPFPYSLTALHAFSGTIGSYIAMELGYFTPARLSTRESSLLTAFSFLYTINIAVSNISLQLVTIPFHQVVRAATPIFIIVLSYIFLSRTLSSSKLLSLVPVIIGVGFATYGDYYFTVPGLLLTLFGTLLAALKTIATHLLQTGHSLSNNTARRIPFPKILPPRALKLHPLDLLLRMSPLAFIQCVIYAQLSGELERVREFGAIHMDRHRAITLAINGAMAFGLNVVSFTANSKVGPLSMTVAANVKQVLTILLAVSIFDLTITPANAVGIALTLLGGAWYAVVEYREKRRRLAIQSLTSPELMSVRTGRASRDPMN
ncbi:TPT-domain-containing protein [Hysterangium stoloniferum]|nr:TPT-domain-containing protein [Hysterangium stoloniferum]